MSAEVQLEDYRYGFSFPDKSVFKTKKGLDEGVVRAISREKQEPEWMTDFRLQSLKVFGLSQCRIGAPI